MNEIMQSEDSFYEFKLIEILLALISLCSFRACVIPIYAYIDIWDYGISKIFVLELSTVLEI
jgi:hypothetical protein